MFCPVCDRQMEKEYCIYGCTPIQILVGNKTYIPTPIKKNCKICNNEFIQRKSNQILCGHKLCIKKWRKEYDKNRPKRPTQRFSKYEIHQKISGELSPEDLLIDKEIKEREERYSRCKKLECQNCRYLFRSFDPNKKFCSKDCEKRAAVNARTRAYEKKIKNLPEKKCKNCKKIYKTLREDVGFCGNCRNITTQLKDIKNTNIKKPTAKALAKQKREINRKLQWSATEIRDPVTRRLKVMRG